MNNISTVVYLIKKDLKKERPEEGIPGVRIVYIDAMQELLEAKL